MWCLVLHQYSRTTKVLAGSILRAENPDDMRLYSWKKEMKWIEMFDFEKWYCIPFIIKLQLK